MSIPAFTDMLLVAAGGMLGCLCRYIIQESGVAGLDKDFITAGINIAGCLIIGIVWSIFAHFDIGYRWRLFILTGLLGGYTTFSTFSLDIVGMIHDGMLTRSMLYLSLSLCGGLMACASGIFITSRILKIIS